MIAVTQQTGLGPHNMARVTSQSILWTALTVLFAGCMHFIVTRFCASAAVKRRPFPFTKLPPELRESIYEFVIDEKQPTYYADTIEQKRATFLGTVAKLLEIGKTYLLSARASTISNPTSCIGLLLANRQIHQELMVVICKRSRFILRIDESNASATDLWDISPATTCQIKHCSLRVSVTPGMVGAVDPRVAPSDWAFRDRAFAQLERMESLQSLTLHIEAIGNQLWNPLWLWHYSSQAFKQSSLRPFKAITLGLKQTGWTPGENHLARRKDGRWEWRCPRDHFVVEDCVGPTPVRQFCHALYEPCVVCGPDTQE